ncbi:hypothetical protein [Pararhizobium gei]|uniref:hypothetical protein n=1 Tax=Pararhizobium gei TaxID=1395951 RepID=UPI0023DCCDAC|nr:hypothetical protein [Rhizobium gei]
MLDLFQGKRKSETGGASGLSGIVRAFILFDEKEYLDANPDVRGAVRAGLFPSGLAHFQANGHKEGRFPGYAGFNWDDYIRANADLAPLRNSTDPEAAARTHFREAGYREGRQTTP